MPPDWYVVDSRRAKPLEESVRRVLKEAGVWVHHPGMLEALAAKGAHVDRDRQRARMTDELIDEAIAMQRGRDLISRPALAYSSEQYTVGMGFEITPRYYDFDAGVARHATTEDLVNMVKLAEVMPEVTSVAAAVTVVDINPLLEPFESFLLVARHSTKPIGGVSLVPPHNPYFAELGEIMSGDRGRYIGTGGWMTSPLCVSERAGELMRLAPHYGKTTASAGSMVIAGLSGPVTRAGAIVVGAAEILGPWIGGLALQPKMTGFRGSAATGVVDPRTGRGCFGTPEAAIQDVGICELFEHWFGGGVGVAGVGYVDGKVPGLQLAAEKVAKAMYIHRARGIAPRIGNPGLIDAGRTFSPVQFLIDMEIDRALWHLHKELDVSAEQIGMDTILEATAEYGSSFIGMEHTARHFRQALWLPEFFDRTANYPPPDQRLEGKILEQANLRWKELVASWRPVERPEQEQIERVVQRAREELPRSGAERFVA